MPIAIGDCDSGRFFSSLSLSPENITITLLELAPGPRTEEGQISDIVSDRKTLIIISTKFKNELTEIELHIIDWIERNCLKRIV